MSETKDDKPFGRPPEYKTEYCQMLIDHMTKGLSFESFAGKIKTCRATLYNWVDKYPDFIDAKKTGADASLLFWEQHGIDGLYSTKEDEYDEKTGRLKKSVSKSLNSAVWIVNMKNRHKWTDRVEVKNNGPVQINLGYTLGPPRDPYEKTTQEPGHDDEPVEKPG